MKIAVGSDHRGLSAKERVVSTLTRLGHEVIDFGTRATDPVDYPDVAFPVATAVGNGDAERGILICGTGLGMSIAANKVRGVRAAPCHDSVTAELSRSHNDSNVMCLSGDLLGGELIDRMVRIWLQTPFDGGRHARRVDKIRDFEKK
ncbi:MAG: ribose 5-phosphate isomerase B [Gemmataceae bacterium]|nr:ribose 5-phosphate isomerase B [Gemmataceae bacterium]